MKAAPSSAPPTAVVGAGKLTRALLPGMLAAGYPVVGVAATRAARARSAARGIPGVLATTSATRAVADARLVLLAVPDGRIASVARELAAGGGTWKGRVVLHHAGALGLEPLRPLARRGAAVGVLHPLQVLGDPGIARRILPGSRARIEGHPRARAAASRLARALGLVPLRFPKPLRRRDRLAYHAAASLVSNDLVALLAQGTDLLTSTGLPRQAALAALARLALGTLTQVDEKGIAAALTGPVTRGDVATLEGQLTRIAAVDGDAAAVHRMLSRRLLDLALAEGLPLTERERQALRDLLAGPSPDRGV